MCLWSTSHTSWQFGDWNPSESVFSKINKVLQHEHESVKSVTAQIPKFLAHVCIHFFCLEPRLFITILTQLFPQPLYFDVILTLPLFILFRRSCICTLLDTRPQHLGNFAVLRRADGGTWVICIYFNLLGYALKFMTPHSKVVFSMWPPMLEKLDPPSEFTKLIPTLAKISCPRMVSGLIIGFINVLY